jgi:hypothetical protein
VPLLGAVGRCAFAIVALYFFTFGAPAASAICGVRDARSTATAEIIVALNFIRLRIQIFALDNTPKLQQISAGEVISRFIYYLMPNNFFNFSEYSIQSYIGA